MTFDQYCYCLEEILRFPDFSKNDNWIVSKSVKLLCFFSEQNKNQIQFYKFVVYHSCIALQYVLLLLVGWPKNNIAELKKVQGGAAGMTERVPFQEQPAFPNCLCLQSPLMSVVTAASQWLLNYSFHSRSSVQTCLLCKLVSFKAIPENVV